MLKFKQVVSYDSKKEFPNVYTKISYEHNDIITYEHKDIKKMFKYCSESLQIDILCNYKA